MAKVTLDKETFKALASETRLDVLRALDSRRKTGSELARELGLNKATVHEHLQLLESVGLVRRLDEGRKWIYWELTWSGRNLLHPETGATFSVLLGLATLAAGGGILSLGRALGWWLMDRDSSDGDDGGEAGTMAAPEDASQDSAGDQDAMRLEAPADDGATFFDDGGWLSIALFVTVAVLLVAAFLLRRRA